MTGDDRYLGILLIDSDQYIPQLRSASSINILKLTDRPPDDHGRRLQIHIDINSLFCQINFSTRT